MSSEAGQLIEHFFRHESANLIAVLTRLYGFGRIGRLLARILIERTGSGAKLRLRGIVPSESWPP